MKKSNVYVLPFLSVLLITAMVSVLTVVVSEIAYYFQHKGWYCKPERPVSPGNKHDDFSLYREPFTILKQEDYVRILTIGGSTTYGLGVDSTNTWQNMLSSRLNRHKQQKQEIINLGRLGGHLEEFIQNYYKSSTVYISRDKWITGVRPKETDLAEWGWRDLDPDIILLAPVVNDTAPDYLYLSKPNSIANAARRILDAGANSLFFNKLALGFYVKKTLTVLELRNREPVADDEIKLTRIRQEYKKNLVNFIKLWDNHVRIYLIGLPFLFNEEDGQRQADQAAEFWNISDRASIRHEVHYLPRLEKLERAVRAEVAGELNIPYREIGNEIKAMRFPQRLRLYVDSIHMNAQGVKLVADEIFHKVVTDGKMVNQRRGIKIKQ